MGSLRQGRHASSIAGRIQFLEVRLKEVGIMKRERIGRQVEGDEDRK